MGEEEKSIESFVYENRRKKNLEDLGVEGRIMFKWFKKSNAFLDFFLSQDRGKSRAILKTATIFRFP
jgi:hypothetical protein